MGDAYHTNITGKVSQFATPTVGGNVMARQGGEFTFELLGVVTIDQVTETTGEPSKLTCKVDQFNQDGKPLYTAGTIITAEHSGKTPTYTVDGKPADAKAMQVLMAVLDLSGPDKATLDDETFGTDKPQAVGATWPINSDHAAKALSTGGMTVAPEAIKGENMLVRKKNIDGKPMLEIKSTLDSEGIKMTIPGVGEATGGKLSGEIVAVVPVDVKEPLVSKTQKMHLEMNANLPNAMGTVAITIDRDIKEQRDAVK